MSAPSAGGPAAPDDRPVAPPEPPTPREHPSFARAVRFWLKLGFISFGGPTGQIAIMHRELVERLRWISENRFLHALNYCMILPGPEAQQLATYIGWLLHRTWGGILAGSLFVLPSVVILWLLSFVYVTYGDVAWVAAVFSGLKPAVVAIVAAAVIRIGRRALKNAAMWTLAAAAFVAIYFLHAPFPLIIVAAGLVGLTGARLAPKWFAVLKPHGSPGGHGGGAGGKGSGAHAGGAAASVQAGGAAASDPAGGDHAADGAERKQTAADDSVIGDDHESPSHVRPTLARAVRVIVVCVVLWWTPVLLVGLVLGREHALFHEGVFFSKAAMVTFGGAYAVLPYVAQQAVERYAWLSPPQMLDGLGLAETTPGPLIMVVQFVGFLGGYHHPGDLPPLVAATLGALLTTWVTFVPCFLWILLGAPYIETMRTNRRLTAALSAVTAAVVGVVLNLAVWFGLHVLRPEGAGWDAFGVVIAVAAFVVMVRWKVEVVPVIAGAAALGLMRSLV